MNLLTALLGSAGLIGISILVGLRRLPGGVAEYHTQRLETLLNQILTQEKAQMALQDDLQTAVQNILAKNDALIALVANLNTQLQQANTALPAAVQDAITKLTAEAAKDDATLNPPATPAN